MLPRGGHFQPAPCDPEGRLLLKNPVWTPNTEATSQTIDWSQPVEVDDSPSICGSSNSRLVTTQRWGPWGPTSTGPQSGVFEWGEAKG